jgi:3-oxoadipate enol-lactonase
MPYLETNGKRRLYYELDDYTDPWRDAPFIVLQHGFSRSSRFLSSWVPYLSRFYKVVRPDLRGLGKSPTDYERGRDFSAELFIDDLIALMDALRASSVHYCGETLGGILGIVFAATCPERVRTLSVVSTPLFVSSKDNQSTTFGYSSRLEALQKMGARGWAEASNAGRRFPPDADPEMLRWYVDEMGRSDLDVLVSISRWVSQADAVPFLPRVKAPMLGLYATHGPIIDDDQIRTLREKVEDVRIVRLPSRYQYIQNLKPASCALALLHFAAQHDGIACHE